VTALSTTPAVTVRYFAAAEAAAGTAEQIVNILPGSTVQDLIGILGAASGPLSGVLPRCSYLCDGVAVRDTTVALQSGQTVDILPPFAGG
jgi:sulfur-carrier protein